MLLVMPKSSKNPKGQSRSRGKAKVKVQSEPFRLLKSKYYWVSLIAVVLVAVVALGVSMQVPLGNELLMLATVASVLGFAFYVGFLSKQGYSKRATFFFVGASIIGFCIWFAMVLSFNAVGIISQVAGSMGEEFFSATTLTICLVLGAFIGDLIGKNKEPIMSLAYELRGKIRKQPISS